MKQGLPRRVQLSSWAHRLLFVFTCWQLSVSHGWIPGTTIQKRAAWWIGDVQSSSVILISIGCRRYGVATRRQAAPSNGEKETSGSNQKKGYKFGDISRFLTKSATTKINKLTGNDTYQFGDLSKWIDRRVKDKISDLSGKDTYEFGDLTRWVDSVAKEKVSNFTQNKNSTYEFGDISREIVRRVKSGEYTSEDVFLALRLLLAAGANLTPIASVLPFKWLLQLINFGIAEDIAGKLLNQLATVLDERIKETLTGDPKYQLGDISKRKLTDAVLAFTGKDAYEFGDISKRVGDLSQDDKTKIPPGGKTIDVDFTDDLNGFAKKELEEWDKRFQQTGSKL